MSEQNAVTMTADQEAEKKPEPVNKPVPRNNAEYLNQVIDECVDTTTKAALLALRHNVTNDDRIHFLLKEVARHEARVEAAKQDAKRAKEDQKQCLDELQTTLADMRDGSTLFAYAEREQRFLEAKIALEVECKLAHDALFAEGDDYRTAIEAIVEVEVIDKAFAFHSAHPHLGHIDSFRISRLKTIRAELLGVEEEEPAEVIDAPAAAVVPLHEEETSEAAAH